MEKMLVVVFDNEPSAYEGSRALNQLDAEGSITIHAESVIMKDANGRVSVMQAEDDFPVRTVGGTAIGSLIGLLGGPVGFGIGAAAGALAGSIGDLYVAGVNADFLDDVSAALTAGKCAVVADVSEEWVTPADSRMEAVGGVVFRTPKTTVEDDQRARDVAELKEEIAQLKAEHAQARAERKEKLQARIEALNGKLQEKLDQAKQRSEQIKGETEAKVQALQNRAAKAQGDARRALDARVGQIQGEYEERSRRLKDLAAEQLKKAAGQLEK
ncbi:MAG TPA: DUF1269 domain-containing protein [Candidatus Acidoferrales bacterium]|jgi:uncharacterized membrane protein|nr:DUF1269 domain-containing protein [Candidatus Acidoferrales bacterium]